MRNPKESQANNSQSLHISCRSDHENDQNSQNVRTALVAQSTKSTAWPTSAPCKGKQPGNGGITARVRWHQQEITAQSLDSLLPATNHLHIRRSTPSQDSWSTMFQSIQLRCQLTVLWINYCCLNDTVIEGIADHLRNIQHICISKNNISDRGAVRLSHSLKAAKTLNVSCNNIGDEGAVALVLALPQLSRLFLDGNQISECCKLLLKSQLSAEHCQLGL